MKIMKTFQPIFFFITFHSLLTFSHSLPLATNGRFIVDEVTGQRVKLTCVNWVSHAQAMLAEGMDKRPLKNIVSDIKNQGFNCVRLTYSTQMFTRFANLTIGETFDNLDIKSAKAGLVKYNPFMLNKTVVEAFETVVDELGEQGVMVHIDNHISQPRWCCSLDDGNGFWGDRHFHVEEWLKGLAFVAKRLGVKQQVVSMSLRNELRGSKNASDWYNYVYKGVNTIHTTTPKLLVFVSGLNYDNDLSFLKNQTLNTTLNNKVVLEAHLYSFSGDPQSKFTNNSLNSICAKIIGKFKNEASFVVIDEKNPFPLVVSEFGYDQRGTNEADNRYMTCFLSHLAEKDLDWALWAWQGSYYYREGAQQTNETFGMVDSTWNHLRNPKVPQMLQLVKRTNQDLSLNLATSYMMHFPLTGQCVNTNNKTQTQLSNCTSASSRWSHGEDGEPIRLMGSAMCLKLVGDGLPPILSNDCSSEQTAWFSLSESKLHLATRDEQGIFLCLEKESLNSTAVVTRRCICAGDDPRCLDDPRSQWFKLVLTNTN